MNMYRGVKVTTSKASDSNCNERHALILTSQSPVVWYVVFIKLTYTLSDTSAVQIPVASAAVSEFAEGSFDTEYL